MANMNANVYPALGINAQNQVFGVDANNQIHPLSPTDFAEEIAISGNGIIWAISGTPDPPSGSVLFWSAGDGNWTAAGKVPGAVLLTGGADNQALFITEDDELWSVFTNGSAQSYGTITDIQEFDYGGGYLWATFPEKPGGPAILQFANLENGLTWQPFAGFANPSGISSSYSGDCYGATDFSPMFYSSDGKTSNSAGSGADGSTLALTFKNTFYGLSTSANADGNKVLIWVDEMGGTFSDAGFQAIQVLATYYMPNS